MQNYSAQVTTRCKILCPSDHPMQTHVGQVPTQHFFGGVPGRSRGGPGGVSGGLRARSRGGGGGKFCDRSAIEFPWQYPRHIDGISTPARRHFSGDSSIRELTGVSQGNPRGVAEKAEKCISYWKMSDFRSPSLGLVSLVGLAGWFG